MHRTLFTALVLAGLAAPFAFADRLDLTVPVPGATSAEVPERGVSTVGFLATEGDKRKLLLLVKRAKKSPLAPTVRLLQPDGTELDIVAAGGSVKANSKVVKIKLASLPATGLWRVEVDGEEETAGGYSLKLKAKEGVKDKGSVLVPVGRSAPIEFTATANSELTLSLKKGRGTSLTPTARVLDPNGREIAELEALGGVDERKGTAKLKKFRLPHFGTYRVEVFGADGRGGTVNYSLAVKSAKIKGELPVAVAPTSISVEPGVEAQLDGASSTGVGAGPLAFSWTQVAGEPVTLDDPTSATPRFTAPETAGPLGFELSVSQNGTRSAAIPVGVEVAPRPVADAGASQRADAGATVTLDGSRSRGGEALRATWTQISGTTVTLDDPGSATPSFTAPATAGTLRFGLIVDDGTSRSETDEVSVVVASPELAVADAGRVQTVGPMSTVHLSALRSLPAAGDATPTFSWTRMAGPEIELAGDDTATPSFMAPRTDADFLFRVTADGLSETADFVTVRVRGGEVNEPPISLGNGPFEAGAGTVQLSGAASTDADGDDLESEFLLIEGGSPSPVQRVTANTAEATILAGAQVQVFAVQAFDGRQYGAPDRIRVTPTGFSGGPLAHAGPDRAALPGNPVQLDGTSSRRTDGGLDPLTFQWRQITGLDWYDATDDGFDGSVPRPTVTLPTDLSSLSDGRTLSFELVVSDGATESVPDVMTVRFTGIARNGRPIATAGVSNATPPAGTLVTLDGQGTDRDGDPLTFLWEQIGGPSVDLSPDVRTASPSFTAPDAGELRFRLTVDDGIETSAPSDVVVTVNERPTAAFTYSPSDAEPGDTVTVDAADSSDPEGADLTFTWTQTAGTTIATPAQESFTFTATEDDITLRLVVNDGVQDSLPTTVTFSAQGAVDVAPTASVTNAAYGESVTLRSNPSDTAGVTYQWRQINAGTDPVVTLSSTTAENPTFTVPLPSTAAFGSSPQATFGVIATRSGQPSAERTVVVTFFASFNATSRTGNTVYSVIQQNRCLSCHSGTNNSCPVGSGGNGRGYGMGTASAFFTNTVGASSCRSSKRRVTARDTSNSYLLDRLQGIGGLMPTGGPGVGTTNLNLVRDWIDQGAQNN